MNDIEEIINKSINEKIQLFFELRKKNESSKIMESIYHELVTYRKVSLSDIVLLQELYEKYGALDAIECLERILRWDILPFDKEGEFIASFYKKEMINRKINYNYNVSELINKEVSTTFIKCFENEYMIKLCYNIVTEEKSEFLYEARKIISKIEENNNQWWFGNEKIEEKKYIDLIDIFERGTLSECFTSFFQLSEEERQKFLREGILEKIVLGGYNLKYIVFLARLYNCYGYTEAICMVEHILSVWFPPYLQESYELAAFYKRKMIQDKVFYEENVESIFLMEDKEYRSHFEDGYILQLCEQVLKEDCSENLKQLAKQEMEKINSKF